MIIEITILNHELYAKYVEKVPEIVKKYGGGYLVRGGEVIPMFGNWDPERIVLIEFDTVENLRNCFNSSEYLGDWTLQRALHDHKINNSKWVFAIKIIYY
ncbi:MAG: DUF1330 domain-containing protein [Methanosarcina sp.]